MKIGIVNGHLPNYEPLAKLTTWGNRTEYCKRHGYDLHVKINGWTHPARHPVSYDRLEFMLNLLREGKYDWLWCSGTDTYHTNFTIPLESFIDVRYHVIASPDWCVPIQADSFFVRNSPEGIAWLAEILGTYPQYKDHLWVENMAMVDLFPKFKDIIKILPQRQLNAYNYRLYEKMYPGQEKVLKGLDFFGNDGRWQRGDFLIHWPGLPFQLRIKLVDVYSKLVVK